MGTSLGDLTIGINATLDPLKKSLDGGRRMVGDFAKNVTRSLSVSVSDPLKNLGRSALGTAAGFGLAMGVGELAGGLKDSVFESVKLAAAWKKSAVSFEVLLGSADRAKAMLGDLRAFAAESPLTLTDSITEATKLLAAGVTQDQIEPTLRMLSDLAMGDKTKFGRASLAFSQIKSTGHVQGDELNQLRELGIPIVREIAKAKGVTEDAVADLVRTSQVSFRDVVAAMKGMTSAGGQFFGMTERGSQTLEGQFERLRDAAEDIKREFGRAVIEEAGLLDATKDGTRFLDQMKATVNDLRPGIRFVADTLKGGAQVVGELARNGPLFARAFGESFRANAPAMAAFVDQAGDFLKRLKDFKLDPDAVINSADLLATTFGVAFDGLFKDVFGGMTNYWKANIQPLLDDLKSAADTWKAMKGWVSGTVRTLEVRDATPDKLREMALNEPTIQAAADKLKALGAEFKAFADPASADALKVKDRFKALNGAMHDALGAEERKLNLEKYNSRLDFGVQDPRTFPADIPRGKELRAALPAAEADAVRARRDLERALATETRGPVESFIKSFDRNALRDALKGLRDEFAARNVSDATRDATRAALLGNAALFQPPKVRNEVKLPDGPAVGFEGPRLASAAEFGSQMVAEMMAQAMAQREQPMLTEAQKQTELLTAIAENTGRPAGPISPAPARLYVNP